MRLPSGAPMHMVTCALSSFYCTVNRMTLLISFWYQWNSEANNNECSQGNPIAVLVTHLVVYLPLKQSNLEL